MSLNLKPVLNAQTDNEKLDVVNYNFDQIVNNGGGPRGYQGATGSQGLAGLTGAQGSQGTTGPTGVQGFQGAASIDLWNTNTSPASNTLVPKHGVQTNPPTVMYGVDKLDPLYTSVFDEAAVLLNRKSTAYGYNLELTDDGVTAADGNKIIYSLANVSGVSNFQMGFYNTTSGNPTQWKLYSDHFDFSDGTNHFAAIGSGGFYVSVPSQFRNTSTFEGLVKINSGNPGDGKVLTSTDTQGTVAWKNVSEIGGVVPVGTIVPILTSVFDDTDNFYKDAITSTLTSGQKLKIRHGAGYGAYAGWYLCNGQTWLSGTGNSRVVPNLCSFDYEIDDNTADTAAGGQFGTQGQTPNLAIVGGANVLMNADYATGTSSYSITDTITSGNVTIHTGESGSPVYDLNKLVYIVYIGEEDWYWQDGGTAGGATVTHYYLLYKYISTSNNTATVNYTSSPSSTYTTTDTTGTTVSISITLTPNSGYSFTSGSNISLWAPTGGSIFGVSPDASVTQSSSVLNPNGTITLTLSDSSYPASTDPTTSNLIIIGNAAAASSATGLTVKRSTVGFAGTSSGSWSNETVYINGSGNLSTVSQIFGTSSLNSSPTAGWYAQSLSGGWAYRYWNGSSFGTMNMTGVSNSPGNWYAGTGDSLIAYGGVGGYPRSVVQLQTGYSACDFYKQIVNGSYGTARNVWTSQQYPSNLSAYAQCFVVADNYHSGNTNYVSIDWTNNGYELGYASLDPCFGLFQYSHLQGTLTRLATACTDVNSTLYDNASGTGTCSYSGGGGGGGGSYS
jgi:hypothetical protein